MLAAITRHPTGGGIAAVSNLVWRVFENRWGSQARLLTMFEHDNRPATFLEKSRFTVSLACAQAIGRTDWILFAHAGLAQVQSAIPRRFRCRYGVLLYGIEAWNPLGAAEQQALAEADVRIAISSYTAGRVLEMHKDIGPIDVCPLALAPAALSPPRSAADMTLPLGPHVVLVVARMIAAERYKGHDQVIDAWPAVVARVPDAQLVIVGTGDDRPRLMNKAEQSSAAASILFTGFVPDATLDTLYRRAALFALPSRGEGFGLVYLEAMARGVPCVGSIHDAAREVIADGETGRLVDQGDVGALAEAIAALLIDETQRLAMGEAGRLRVRDCFTFEHFRERLCGLLPADPPHSASASVPAV